MPLIFGAIAPHGGQIIPALASTPEEAAATRAAMTEMGRRLEALAPDTVVVVTPHGIRIDGTMCISVSTRAAGDLGPEVAVDFDVDQPLAHAIAAESVAAGVPVAKCIYGASSGPSCVIPMDWGALIPLWFMGHTYSRKPQVVVICPSRSLSLQQMVDFGKAVARAAEASGKRVALIGSSDQGHAHQVNGPYGYDPASAVYDNMMVETVKRGDLLSLLKVDPNLVEAAKPDSLWQTLILAGALEVTPMQGEFLSYEVPTYFGMLCASYQLAL